MCVDVDVCGCVCVWMCVDEGGWVGGCEDARREPTDLGEVRAC